MDLIFGRAGFASCGSSLVFYPLASAFPRFLGSKLCGNLQQRSIEALIPCWKVLFFFKRINRNTCWMTSFPVFPWYCFIQISCIERRKRVAPRKVMGWPDRFFPATHRMQVASFRWKNYGTSWNKKEFHIHKFWAPVFSMDFFPSIPGVILSTHQGVIPRRWRLARAWAALPRAYWGCSRSLVLPTWNGRIRLQLLQDGRWIIIVNICILHII